MTRRLVPRIIAVSALVACLALLAVGSSALPPPPADPTELPTWWASSDPALALGSLLRLVAGALCTWLLVVTGLELVATVSGRVRAARLVGRLAPEAWRTLVLRPVAAGTLALPVLVSPIGLVAPTVAGATTIEADAGPLDSTGPVTAVLTMTLCDDEVLEPVQPPELDDGAEAEPVDGTSTTSTTWAPPASAPPSTTSTTVPPASLPPTATTTAPPASSPPPVHPEDLHDHTMIPPQPIDETMPPAPSTANAEIHVVAPGESFWSIATARVATHLGRAPDAREVGPYWVALVAANADRLPVPGNPDLLFPGDEVILPAW